MLAPVARGIEPGEGPGEHRVLPAAGQPGAVVKHPEGAQRLDQAQFAGIEIEEFRVSFDDGIQLRDLARPLAREHHPEVLYRRRRPRVVEIDEMGRVVSPEDVPRMAVAVSPDLPDRSDTGNDCLYGFEQLGGQGRVTWPVFVRDKSLGNECHAGAAET